MVVTQFERRKKSIEKKYQSIKISLFHKLYKGIYDFFSSVALINLLLVFPLFVLSLSFFFFF